MSHPAPLTSPRIVLAFVVAILTDLVQLPLSMAFDTAVFAIPAEAAILFIDGAAFIITTRLLGFHWLLLPSLAVEAIPNLDAMPTWTGCVAFVVWSRKNVKEGAIVVARPKQIAGETPTHSPTIIDV